MHEALTEKGDLIENVVPMLQQELGEYMSRLEEATQEIETLKIVCE